MTIYPKTFKKFITKHISDTTLINSVRYSYCPKFLKKLKNTHYCVEIYDIYKSDIWQLLENPMTDYGSTSDFKFCMKKARDFLILDALKVNMLFVAIKELAYHANYKLNLKQAKTNAKNIP